MKYLITGGQGFLGRHLIKTMLSQQIEFTATVRAHPGPHEFATGDLSQFTNWFELFRQVDVVIHAAAKAHDMSGAKELKDIYLKTNYELTIQLAKQAKLNQVKKFIFISTIKVNGEMTGAHPFTADDEPHPQDDYGRSKLLAEDELMQLQEPGQFDVVIIRPCLIYGAGLKANFANLIKLIKKNWPLPLGALKNKRSFVSIDNLIHFILRCAESQAANGQKFLVSDGKDLSLPELIRTIGHSFGLRPQLIPVPISLMKLGLFIIGRKDISQRLFSSLQVDIDKSKRLLNWQPPFTMAQSLLKMKTESA